MSQQMTSLWGDEFTIPSTKDVAKKIVDKINNEKTDVQLLKSKKTPINVQLDIIKKNVDKVLGRYVEDTVTIRDKSQFSKYISEAISAGVIAIDTETNRSLDPLTCKIMGLCIYTPGQKRAYIPVNHVDPETGERLNPQLAELDIKEELERLIDTKIIMHHGKFDFQVIKCTCDIELPIYWDTMVGAQIIDENEPAKLKEQYRMKIDPSSEKYNIETFFSEIPYEYVDPDLFALYAATDAYMTYKLYEWQKDTFNKAENRGIYNLFKNIEMPLLRVTIQMELDGIAIDKEYAKRLSDKYHKLSDDLDKEINKELDTLHDKILEWRLTPEANKKSVSKNGKEGKSKSEQLSDPVSVSSPTQLAILIYDVLKLPVVDKKNPRGTGEDQLQKLSSKGFTLGTTLLKKRGIDKLLNTFIDKLPENTSPVDSRLHAHFNQMGREDRNVRTGRFSSSDPNLQNIPSHARDVRMLFCASPGYKMIGADFSQAEPRLLAWYSQDEHMMQAYIDKKDLYATIASIVYKNKYEDNLEFNPDGSMNNDGKERRTFMKSVLLGIMYGRGAASIAEQVGKTMKEAQGIIDQFYESFPSVKKWVDDTQQGCRERGYVETIWGRRRRLPDIQLPRYSVTYRDGNNSYFNPLLDVDKSVQTKESPAMIKYKKAVTSKTLNNLEYEKIKEDAFREGINVDSNVGFIAQAERQAVNARVQGGSADVTKRAMIAVYNDEVMRSLGFRLLLCVHDELIGECPEENAEKAAERLTELMLNAPKPECQLPFKCDADIFDHWYASEYETQVRADFEKCGKDYAKIYEMHSESLPEYINKIVA